MILVLFCIIFSALASLFLKIGSNSLVGDIEVRALLMNITLWCGAIFYASAFFGYIFALRTVPLSLVQPTITAGVSIVTALIAVLYFKESMGYINWLGMIMVCVGVLLLAVGRV